LNIALIGTEEEIILAMTAAGWDPADPLTFRSSVRIVVDTVLRKPDDEAPVSNLYLFGRKEDLAFEKPVGGSPKERHHVRFWHMEKTYDDRPAWIGSAAYDIGVELSRTTGQVTHHISLNIDAAWSEWRRRSMADRRPFGQRRLPTHASREQPDPARDRKVTLNPD